MLVVEAEKLAMVVVASDAVPLGHRITTTTTNWTDVDLSGKED